MPTRKARSEATLVGLGRRAREGDGKALDLLLREVQGPVEEYLARRLSARRDARDAAADLRQEVLLRVAAALARGRFDNDRQLLGWVLTIARNVLIDHLRSEQGRCESSARRLDVLGEAASLARWRAGTEPAGPDPLERLAAEAMRVLPERTRELLLLRVQLAWSWKEVGRALRTSEAGVKRRFQRAQAILRARLLERVGALPPDQRAAVLRRWRGLDSG